MTVTDQLRALQRRIDRLVGRLRLLMEGEALKIASPTSHGKQESRPPKGVQLDRSTLGPFGTHPDRDPLLLCFLERLDAADSVREKVRLTALYETLCDKRHKPVVGRIAGGTLDGDTVSLSNEDVKSRNDRILDDYEGCSPVEVSAIESESYGWCSEAAVRATRRLGRRHPETGRPLEGADDDRAYAKALRAEGHTLQEIADSLGRPKSTVQSWLKAAA